jgi:hypothetical protein
MFILWILKSDWMFASKRGNQLWYIIKCYLNLKWPLQKSYVKLKIDSLQGKLITKAYSKFPLKFITFSLFSINAIKFHTNSSSTIYKICLHELYGTSLQFIKHIICPQYVLMKLFKTPKRQSGIKNIFEQTLFNCASIFDNVIWKFLMLHWFLLDNCFELIFLACFLKNVEYSICAF